MRSPFSVQSARNTSSSDRKLINKKSKRPAALRVTPKAKRNPSLPAKIQTNMESVFGQDFSRVRIHTNSASAIQMNAQAYTQGDHIHFAPGHFNPHSSSGLELLSHELTHVVQQREGRVSANKTLAGKMFNTEASLEHEADERSKNTMIPTRHSGTRANSPSNYGKVIQRKLMIDGPKKEAFVKKINDSATRDFVLVGNNLQNKKKPNLVEVVGDTFTRTVQNGIDHDQGVKFALAHDHDDTILVDHVNNGKVDVDEMLALSKLNFESFLIHFLVERFAIPAYELIKGGIDPEGPIFEKGHELGHKEQSKHLKEKFPHMNTTYVREIMRPHLNKIDQNGNGYRVIIKDFTDIYQVLYVEVLNRIQTGKLLKVELRERG